MTNYEIKTNTQFNSKEIYFTGKPSAEVRTGLKNLKMRWNPSKACWYGFATEIDIIKAITAETQEAQPNEYQTGTIFSDGYMGATRTDGVNSSKYLYGAELSSAIRNHLKAANINGVTVSVKKYAGGQSITAKIKTTAEDLIDFETFKNNFKIETNRWLCYFDDNNQVADVHSSTYFELTAAEQKELKNKVAYFEYQKALNGQDINYFHFDKYPEYTESFMNKIRNVNEIIKSYNYDDSNSMVDYFDTNFYYSIRTVA
jgi:hypothetical protein